MPTCLPAPSSLSSYFFFFAAWEENILHWLVREFLSYLFVLDGTSDCPFFLQISTWSTPSANSPCLGHLPDSRPSGRIHRLVRALCSVHSHKGDLAPGFPPGQGHVLSVWDPTAVARPAPFGMNECVTTGWLEEEGGSAWCLSSLMADLGDGEELTCVSY